MPNSDLLSPAKVNIVLTTINDLIHDEIDYEHCEHCGNYADRCDAGERCTNASMKDGHGRALLIMRGLIWRLYPTAAADWFRASAEAALAHADALENWWNAERRNLSNKNQES